MTVYADCTPSEKKHADVLAFEGRLACLGDFKTKSQFEANFGDKLKHMPQGLALRVFRHGILPLWEDPQNSGPGAGKWILQGGCKLVMGKAFRSILHKMAAEQLTGINGAIAVCKRGQNVVMLWTRAPVGTEANVTDPFGVQLLTADLSEEVGLPLSAGFKPHSKGVNKRNVRQQDQDATKQCDCNSDYELSPELNAAINQMEVAPLGLQPPAGSVQPRAWSMVVNNTRPRAMSWAQKAMSVQ
jgi:hypothetical protein